MMLALLVMGVSNVWGYQYRVLFESGAVAGGYTINTNQNVVTGENDGLVLKSTQQLTSNNISRYITAKPVEGNTAGFVVDTSNYAKQMGTKNGATAVKFDGVIFITYQYNSDVTQYSESDENFNYSNIYTAIYGRNYYDENNSRTSPRVESQIYLGENKVAISLKNTRLENATIPVSDPKGKTVVAIQRFGMTYQTSSLYRVNILLCDDDHLNRNYKDTPEDRSSNYYNESSSYTDHYTDFGYDHRNEYLKTVTFADGSQVASIGDYAFVCCTKLTEVNNIPSTLAFLGQAAFSICEKLTKVDFPIRSNLKSLRDYTFWCCYDIKRLSLPEGLVEIEGTSSGAAMQYMTSLEDLHLPNTLKRVGPHFLCCANSLKTLTIPVTVEYIDGAFLHGCESLETCYILGPAAALVYGSNSNPFSPNYTLCSDPVNNCTFYTTSDNLDGYKNDTAWKKINNNGNWKEEKDGYTWGYGNYLKAIPGETRTLPHKWVTAVFPSHPDNGDYAKIVKKSDFGPGTKVAKMTQCTGYSHESIDGKEYRVYHLYFSEIAAGDDAVIPKGVPLLIKAGQPTQYVFYLTEEQGQDWFKTHYTTPHEVTVHCSQDGADITMKGQYNRLNIQPGEVYFKNNDADFTTDENGNTVEHPKFLLAPETGYVTIDPCRCWWTIEQEGHISQNASTGLAKGSRVFFDDTNDIKKVETRFVIDGIYDLNGHKLDVKQEELPQGLFIINGKKVLKK